MKFLAPNAVIRSIATLANCTSKGRSNVVPILEFVHVTITPEGHWSAVATERHILAEVSGHAEFEGLPDDGIELLIHGQELLTAVKKLSKISKNFSLEINTVANRLIVDDLDGGIGVVRIAPDWEIDRYPKVRELFKPDRAPAESVSFDPGLYGKLCLVRTPKTIFSKNCVYQMEFNGSKAISVSIPGDGGHGFRGLIMPLRFQG